MSAAVKDKAIKYYPAMWSMERLIKLVQAGALTADEYKAVTGEDFTTAE